MATAGQVYADTEFDAAREKLLQAAVSRANSGLGPGGQVFCALPRRFSLTLQEAVLALAADHGLNVRDPSAPASHLHIVGGTAAVHDRTTGARTALKQLVSLAQDPTVSLPSDKRWKWDICAARPSSLPPPTSLAYLPRPPEHRVSRLR